MPLDRENLIISADDFGVNAKANANILRLAKLGKIDRVSVMVNYVISPEEISDLQSTGVKLDMHLDFPKRKKHKQKDSALKRSVLFVLQYLFGKNGSSQIKHTWNEQVEKFYSIFQKYPDGLNSHQHIHFFPAYFKAVLKLAQKYNTGYVRFGKKALAENANRVPRILENLRRRDKNLFFASGLDSSDYWVSLDWIADIEKFLANLPPGKTEIVCHPERQEEFEIINKYF